jgi:two-component system, OmpR family, sensor histidine kinase VicK
LTISAPSDAISKRTEVLHGEQNVLGIELQFFSDSDQKIYTCMNYTRPALAITIEPVRNAFIDAKKRAVKLRYLTEITKDNIAYCKDLISIVDEMRHLDGIKGNFMISESEYLAPAVLLEKGKIASHIIYSNQKEVVEQHQYMFDTLWNKAISAQQRIMEIEQGVEPIQTKVLENKEQIFNHMKSVIGTASERSVCSTIGAMQLIHNNFFEEYKKIIDKHRRDRQGKGIRWITSIIDKDSIDLVKIFLNAGIQVRHVRNLTPMSFAVDNKHFYATIEKMEEGKMMESLLISNEPVYINHYNSIFEELWKNGINAVDRIKDIEQGLDLTYIEVVPSSAKAQEIYLNTIKGATAEILWIFPTANAFIRQDKIGAIPLAKKAAKERNVKIRILVPLSSSIEQKIQKLKENCPDSVIDVKYIEQMTETKATILVVDRKASLVMELRDDLKSTFIEAIGLSTYSNSKAGVLSYVAIFENLWKQSDLYEQLKINDKMQKEFINIAAHELRTPVQPILSLSEILQSDISNNTKQQEFLDAIVRNAKRLQRLTENILDITRIESHSLELRKERFSLNENIINVINDMNNQAVLRNNNNKTVSILFEPEQDIIVEADKVRIYGVISNLLNNAIHFTNQGTINIAAAKKMDYNEVIVSVKDTGEGIYPEIFPRLFTKFATGSVTGTGLGLFISKSIVEAHGGKIWAQNNPDGRGATFYFSLPLSK